MAQAPQVAVVGMRALRRDIEKLTVESGPLERQLVQAGRRAAEPVATETQGRTPRDSGDLAGDVRVTASRTGAAVRMGRASIPYAAPVEFGGWPEGRPYYSHGRYLFPAGEALATTSADLYSTEVQHALDAFGWSNLTNDPEAVHD